MCYNLEKGYPRQNGGIFYMNGLLGQLSQSMQQGVPSIGQVTGGSPNFDAGLQPPTPSPTPDKSPVSAMHLGALHRYYERSGTPKPAQLAQAPTMQPGAPQSISGSSTVTLPQLQDMNPQQPGTQIPVSEAELIIKALSKRLEHHSKTAERVVNAMTPDFSPSPVAGQSAQLK